jgi:hypothetical protein
MDTNKRKMDEEMDQSWRAQLVADEGVPDGIIPRGLDSSDRSDLYTSAHRLRESSAVTAS